MPLLKTSNVSFMALQNKLQVGTSLFVNQVVIMTDTCMLKVKGIHTRSPKTNMKPSLSAIMSHLQKTRNG